MAATFSCALIFFIYFYLYYIYDDAIHFPTNSDALSFSNIGYTTLLGKGNRASRPLSVSSKSNQFCLGQDSVGLGLR